MFDVVDFKNQTLKSYVDVWDFSDPEKHFKAILG